MAKPVFAALGDKWIRCLFCQGEEFRKRSVQLNSSGMELMNLGWANEAATGLICSHCGYVHLFANENIKFYEPKNQDKRDRQDRPWKRKP